MVFALIDSMKILITGSSGVIGSVLCKKIAKEAEVIPFDIKQGFDIRNKNQLLQMVKGIDGVIHCAAVSRVCDCEKDPILCEEVNVIGTKNIVDCLQQQANKPWLLLVSSREVYGQAKNFPVTEDFYYNPINKYAHSKVEAEKIVNRYSNSGVVRLANIYGSATDYENRVVFSFTNAALNNKPLFLNGASNILDFIHIDDAVNGIVLCLKNQLKDTVHLTSGIGISLEELAKKIINLTNSKSKIIEKPAKENEVSCFYGNSSRAKKTLNWEAQIALEYGIKKLIKEMK
jgi:nucleoside-diphosphate-sugar epimerase